MSMSTSVTGFKRPDAKWQQMKAVWDACELANVTVPKEVDEFFNWTEPGDNGVSFDLLYYANSRPHPAVTEYSEEMTSGYEVDISKLPAGVQVIRFTNSW